MTELANHLPQNSVKRKSVVADPATERLLTVSEAAEFLRLSSSWLAKARMRGDGPPYVKLGRSVRYPQSFLRQWMKSQMHYSTGKT